MIDSVIHAVLSQALRVHVPSKRDHDVVPMSVSVASAAWGLHWPTWRALIRHFSAFTAWWAGVCVGGGGGEKKKTTPKTDTSVELESEREGGQARSGRGVGGGETPWKRWPRPAVAPRTDTQLHLLISLALHNTSWFDPLDHLDRLCWAANAP